MNAFEGLRPGTLLVATPDLDDPMFRRAVVYLIAHGDEGSVGVILNRPSETAVHNVLPSWAQRVTRPHVVYAGGPVQESSAMCLGVRLPGTDPEATEGLVRVSGAAVLVNLDADPLEMARMLRGMRIYAGHAGWDARQLESEIVDGSWYAVESVADDLIAGPRVDLWFRVLRRQPFPSALAAYHPGDLTRN